MLSRGVDAGSWECHPRGCEKETPHVNHQDLRSEHGRREVRALKRSTTAVRDELQKQFNYGNGRRGRQEEEHVQGSRYRRPAAACPHTVEGHYGAGRVLIKPAIEGHRRHRRRAITMSARSSSSPASPTFSLSPWGPITPKNIIIAGGCRAGLHKEGALWQPPGDRRAP